LLDTAIEEGEPRGKKVAELLASQLPSHGFNVDALESEDWGWRVNLINEAFPLWIGTGHYQEYPDGHLCFIEPSRPVVRRWFRRISTAETIGRLANALEGIIRESCEASDIRWWDEAENARG
jgi:hypothetical protein